MLDSRLLEHLKVLDSTLSNDFLRFAKGMSVYNKEFSEDTVVLIQYLLKNIRTEDKVQKEIVYRYIYPNQEWKNGKIEKLMSSALKLFKHFVHYKTIGDDVGVKESLALSEFYRKYQLHKLFEQNIKQFDKYKEDIKIQNRNTLYDFFLVEQEILSYQTEFNTRRDDLNLSQTILSFDLFYLVNRLDLTLRVLTQQQYFHFDNNIPETLNDLLSLASHNTYRKMPLIQLFVDAIHIQIKPNGSDRDTVYNNFEKKLIDNKEHIDHQYYIAFCTIARNFCTQQYNNGRMAYLPILFGLYLQQLSDGLLLNDNFIRFSILQNIVGVALKLKKYDFVKEFLEDHQNKISGTRQPQLVWEYNMAFYHFEIGEYTKAIEILPNYLDLDDAFYALAARRLEIKIHIERDKSSKYDLVGNKIDAFKNYLFEGKKNQRITEDVFNRHNDFVDFVKQLRNTLKGDTQRVEKLAQKFEQSPSIAEREWLLDKIKSLVTCKK